VPTFETLDIESLLLAAGADTSSQNASRFRRYKGLRAVMGTYFLTRAKKIWGPKGEGRKNVPYEIETNLQININM